MKLKTKTSKPRYTLSLTEKDAKRLSALADFPLWEKQSQEIQGWLLELVEALATGGNADEVFDSNESSF